MTVFMQDVENIIKSQGEKGLVTLMHYGGLPLGLYRSSNRGDEYSDAYGGSSGSSVEHVSDFIGVLVGDDFIQKSDHYAGNFEEGFLYTRDVNILPDDVVQIKVANNRIRKFKVESCETIGITTDVFTMWKLSNLGD